MFLPSRRSGKRHDSLPGLRLQRGGEQFVTEHGLVRRDASEPTAQLSGALRGERSPHLEETVGKTSFKDRACDGWESRLTTQVDALPDLFLAALEDGSSPEPERLATLKARLLGELEQTDLTIERRFP